MLEISTKAEIINLGVQWKTVITQSSGSIDQTRNISGLTDKTLYSTPTPPMNGYFAIMLVQIKIINIFCVAILTSIKSYLVFSSTETYYRSTLSPTNA